MTVSLRLWMCFSSAIVGGKCLGCLNILKRQAWMVRKNRLGCHAGSKLAQDNLDWDPRASDHGFSAHDFRVDLDSFVHHGVSFRSGWGIDKRIYVERHELVPTVWGQ
jgi:hypothetical protein